MTRLPCYVGAHVSATGGVDRAPPNAAGIGFAVFAFIMQDERFRGIPLVLETIDASIRSEEIQLLRRFSSETAASTGP